MFNNVGKELKQLAETHVRVKTIIASLVGLLIFIVGLVIQSSTRDANWILGVALLVAALYIFGAYQKARLEAIQLYAFGQLVDKVDSIEKNVWYNTPPVTTNQQEKRTSTEEKPDRHPTVPPRTSQPGISGIISQNPYVNAESWYCRHCDTENPGSRTTCKKCGMHK